MSSPQPPERRRLLPAKPQAPSLITILDLGDDLLLRIFLHLPSLPSLVRAALTCRAFLAAVRSSPTFRRRFRALHAAPLLGVYLDPNITNVSSYAPLRRRSDPGFNAAAVRASDIFVAGFPDEIEDPPCGWQVADCSGGYILLLNWQTRKMAAYNPLTKALDLFPAAYDEIMGHRNSRVMYLDYHMLACDESPGSFRVVSIFRDASQVRAAIFSSGTTEWQILPWTEVAPAQRWSNHLCTGAVVNGSLYWSHTKDNYILMLNMATQQFSWIELPDQLKGERHIYRIGETKDENLYIVSATEFTLSVWLLRADADGVEKWMLDNVIQMEGEVLKAVEGTRDDVGGLEVCAILDCTGHLLMKTTKGGTCWFLSFCLETKKLGKVFHKKFDNFVCPYIMAWPPSLVGNARELD